MSNNNERFLQKLLNLGDVRDDIIEPVFPRQMKIKDAEHDYITKKYFDIMGHTFQNQLENSLEIEHLLDPEKVRADLIDELGRSLSVVIDETESEEFQRTLIMRSTGLFSIKGTRVSYQVRGRASGFDVQVQNYWRIAPELVQFFSSGELQEIPEGSFQDGKYYTNLPPGTKAGTPTEECCEYCLTSYIKLKFIILELPPPSATGNFLDKVILKIRKVVAAHVRDVFFDLEVFMRADLYIKCTTLVEEKSKVPCFFWYYDDVLPDSDFDTYGLGPLS